jgi:hypothetical protein
MFLNKAFCSLFWGRWRHIFPEENVLSHELSITGYIIIMKGFRHNLPAMSITEIDEILKSHRIISGSDGRAARVKIVGRNIRSAAGQYFRQNDLSPGGYALEFNLVGNTGKS